MVLRERQIAGYLRTTIGRTVFNLMLLCSAPLLASEGVKECHLLLIGSLPGQNQVTSLQGMHGAMSKFMARWQDPVSVWFKRGVVLTYEDVGMPSRRRDEEFVFARRRFEEFAAEMHAHGLYLRQNWNVHLTDFKKTYELVFEFVKERSDFGNVPFEDYFKTVIGFYPTPENLRIFREVGEKYTQPTRDVGIIFGPYQEIKKFEDRRDGNEVSRLAGYPEKYQKALEGIRSFLNDPGAVEMRLTDVKNFVQLIRLKTNIPESEAVEKMRHFYEVKNGFIQPAQVLTEILTSEQWHSKLREGILLEESNDSHSLWSKTNSLLPRYYGIEHRRVHRDQWLLIMIEMEKNPERFGKDCPSARDLFQSLGRTEWMSPHLRGEHQFGVRARISGLDSNNLWYLLFDHVDEEVNFANASNPFYFNELWTRHTGLSRTN